MKDTTHEDAELLNRVAGVAARLDYSRVLRLLGYAKGLALISGGVGSDEAVTAQTFDEAVGLCDAFQTGGSYEAPASLLDVFCSGHTVQFVGYDGMLSYAKGRLWEEPTTGAEGVTVR